jgi:hypothetical protein
LNAEQKLQLFKTLVKYLPSLTDKPGKCTLLKYEFQVKTDQPVRSFSRPVPFALRPAVKEQIQTILRDDILVCFANAGTVESRSLESSTQQYKE